MLQLARELDGGIDEPRTELHGRGNELRPLHGAGGRGGRADRGCRRRRGRPRLEAGRRPWSGPLRRGRPRGDSRSRVRGGVTTPLARLAAFAVLLAVVAGAAALIGRASGLEVDTAAE